MPYRDSPYGHIPGVVGTYLDGAFKIPTTSTQPKVLVIGPALSGQSNEIFRVASLSAAEKEFGAKTPLMRVCHELVSQGANNLYVVRSGGRQGSFVLEDSNGKTLTIRPESRDDEILDRYALFIENDGVENRYLIYDLVDQSWVFDTSNVLVIDEGAVDVEDTGIDLFTLNDVTVPDSAVSLSSLLTSDLSVDGEATVDTITFSEGSDGLTPSLVERYAAYNSTYHLLDYRDADFIIPADAYIDDANVVDDSAVATYGYFWFGVPTAKSPCDKLGYLWQYVYRGKLYTYFTDTVDYFSVESAQASVTVATSLTLTAKAGKGGNACTVQIAFGGSPAAGVSLNDSCGIDVLVTVVEGVTTTEEAADLINAVLELEGWSELLVASGDTDVIASVVAKTALSGGAGGHVLTHEDLTGDVVPTEVETRFAAGVDAELRECNFAHQLASYCYTSSTTWSTMLGVVSFKAPTGFSRLEVAEWVGTLPEYTDNGEYQYIDAPADNGSGVLGCKLLAGQSKTSSGYRSHLVTDGNSTDGYAYGGLIRTTGAALPNGIKHPYGIDSADEAEDSGGKPIDIGKHIFVTYEWLIHSNGYAGGTTYRGSLPGVFAGKLVTMPENEEPIGINGRLVRVQSPLRIHATQLDHLADIRTVGVRREETGAGFIIVSAKTAAHPDSDYTRVSTIRCVNKVLSDIRAVARPYIGKSFDPSHLASLQSAIDLLLVSERSNGFTQGARAAISFSRQDKIMGNLTIKVRMVPPFSVDSILVTTSLAAEESEL